MKHTKNSFLSKVLLIAVLLLAICMVFVACNNNSGGNDDNGGGNGGNGGNGGEPISFSVTFDSNGGSAVADKVCQSGQTIVLPAAPVKDGYDFVGWYTDSTFATVFDVNQAITQNITLYAKWELTDVQAALNRAEATKLLTAFAGQSVVLDDMRVNKILHTTNTDLILFAQDDVSRGLEAYLTTLLSDAKNETIGGWIKNGEQLTFAAKQNYRIVGEFLSEQFDAYVLTILHDQTIESVNKVFKDSLNLEADFSGFNGVQSLERENNDIEWTIHADMTQCAAIIAEIEKAAKTTFYRGKSGMDEIVLNLDEISISARQQDDGITVYVHNTSKTTLAALLKQRIGVDFDLSNVAVYGYSASDGYAYADLIGNVNAFKQIEASLNACFGEPIISSPDAVVFANQENSVRISNYMDNISIEVSRIAPVSLLNELTKKALGYSLDIDKNKISLSSISGTEHNIYCYFSSSTEAQEYLVDLVNAKTGSTPLGSAGNYQWSYDNIIISLGKSWEGELALNIFTYYPAEYANNRIQNHVGLANLLPSTVYVRSTSSNNGLLTVTFECNDDDFNTVKTKLEKEIGVVAQENSGWYTIATEYFKANLSKANTTATLNIRQYQDNASVGASIKNLIGLDIQNLPSNLKCQSIECDSTSLDISFGFSAETLDEFKLAIDAATGTDFSQSQDEYYFYWSKGETRITLTQYDSDSRMSLKIRTVDTSKSYIINNTLFCTGLNLQNMPFESINMQSFVLSTDNSLTIETTQNTTELVNEYTAYFNGLIGTTGISSGTNVTCWKTDKGRLELNASNSGKIVIKFNIVIPLSVFNKDLNMFANTSFKFESDDIMYMSLDNYNPGDHTYYFVYSKAASDLLIQTFDTTFGAHTGNYLDWKSKHASFSIVDTGYSLMLYVSLNENKLEDLCADIKEKTDETIWFDPNEFVGTFYNPYDSDSRRISVELFFEEDTADNLIAFLETKYSTTEVKLSGYRAVVTKNVVFYVGENVYGENTIELSVYIQYPSATIEEFYNNWLGVDTLTLPSDVPYFSYDESSGDLEYTFNQNTLTKLVSSFETATDTTAQLTILDPTYRYYTITCNGKSVHISSYFDASNPSGSIISVSIVEE